MSYSRSPVYMIGNYFFLISHAKLLAITYLLVNIHELSTANIHHNFRSLSQLAAYICVIDFDVYKLSFISDPSHQVGGQPRLFALQLIDGDQYERFPKPRAVDIVLGL